MQLLVEDTTSAGGWTRQSSEVLPYLCFGDPVRQHLPQPCPSIRVAEKRMKRPE